jgi:NHLM bacteriocin system ABC transporter peptidase/ATP-binding protein
MFWRRSHRTPTVIQMEAVECGAAALGIILAYHGRWVSLETLRFGCGVSRDGCDAFDMAECSERYGMKAGGFWCDKEGVAEIALPAILYWDSNHFVVLEEMGDQWIHINDPATGPRKISHDEFDKYFSGLVLELTPGPEFEKGGEKPSLLKAVSHRIRRVKRPLSFVLLAQAGLVLMGLAMPVFTRIFIDSVIGQRLLGWQNYLLGGMAFAAVLSAGLMRLSAYSLNRLNRSLTSLFSAQFLWHVIRLPMRFFLQRFGGEIINRIALNQKAASLLTSDFALVNVQAIFMLSYLLIMALYDLPLTAVAMVGGIANVITLTAVARARRNAYSRLQQESARSAGVTISALQQMDAIKASGASSYFFARIAGFYAKIGNALQAIGKRDALLSASAGLTSSLATAFLLGIGCYRVMQGGLTIGMLIAFQLLLSSFLAPFLQLMNFANQGETLKIDLMRLDDVFRNELDPQIIRAPSSDGFPPKLTGALELKEVTFGYHPLDRPFIERLSLKVEPGELVALVGPVGCGKSTIAKIACNLLPPWSGEVCYDGQPAKMLPRETLASSVAVVDQEIALFAGTVKENLTLWDETIPEEDILDAARDACIHDEIMARENGYYALLTEGGSNLSGGQRQRLEIARALALRPSTLILDEATSSLDAQLETQVADNIRRRGIACLVIAHRLNTIIACDRIIVVEQGAIVDRGTIRDVRERGEFLDRLKNIGWQVSS